MLIFWKKMRLAGAFSKNPNLIITRVIDQCKIPGLTPFYEPVLMRAGWYFDRTGFFVSNSR